MKRASVALALALSAVAQGWAIAQGYPPQVLELVARARQQIRTIDMATFRAALGSGNAGLLIDVREPQEFGAGHIPGAVNIPRGQIELAIWQRIGYPDRLDTARKITLYCGSGVRCILAAKSLQDLGLTNVAAVDMRLEDWVKAGHPYVTD